MKITESAVRRRIATSAIVIALAGPECTAFGDSRKFCSQHHIPINPTISWPGATPEEIDKDLADPIERQLAAVDGLDYLESSSIEGLDTALVNFKGRRGCERGLPGLPGRDGEGFQEPSQKILMRHS